MPFTKQPNKTPRVPIETPVFNEDSAQDLTLSRTWVIFFERLFQGAGKGGGEVGPFLRTLDVKDSTIGDDIADATIVHSATDGSDSTVVLVAGVLRQAITSDLTVRLKVWVGGVSSVVGTFTIGHTTPINTAVSFTTFTTATLPDLSVLTWDITASDGSIEADGVASFSVWWQ